MESEVSSMRALRPTEDGHMAKTDLIKGIDNTCDAVRRAVTRAQANGSVWRTGPLLKGINNDDVEALRRRTARAKAATASGDPAEPALGRPPIQSR